MDNIYRLILDRFMFTLSSISENFILYWPSNISMDLTPIIFNLTAGNEFDTAWKVSKYGVIFGPYFLAFGLNTEISRVNLQIQSEYRKIRTRNNPVFGHFSRSVSQLGDWRHQSAFPIKKTYLETLDVKACY